MKQAKSKAPEKGWFGWFRSVGGRIAPAVIYDFITADEKTKAVALRDLEPAELALPLDALVAKYPVGPILA